MEGGAAARLQALRKRHAKPSTKVVVQRTRKRMRECTSWERSDLVKVRGRPRAARGGRGSWGSRELLPVLPPARSAARPLRAGLGAPGGA